MDRIAVQSPRLKTRAAGALDLFSLVTAVLGETYCRGRLAYAVGYVAIAGMFAMTLLFYVIFRPVSRGVALFASLFNLVGLAFETVRVHPWGVNAALVLTGIFCILFGYLIFRSSFLPRVFGVLMMIAGLGWLTYLSPSFAVQVSPYNLAAGIVSEVLVFLWMLAKGVNVQRWKERAGAA
jgi:hypothetical protein